MGQLNFLKQLIFVALLFIKIRLTCNHPQLILRKSTFVQQNVVTKGKNALLTMEKSLDILLKKTQQE